MISVIICSRTPDISVEMRQNIANSIGCDHEIIIIDNSNNDYSIFSAYNEGIRRSKGDILCFCHEDIMFRSGGWGNEIQNLLEDDSIGLVGVAGAHFFPSVPMYWWLSPYISQYNLTNSNGKQIMNKTIDYFDGELADVVAVDGMCFFIPKSLFSSITFDESTYSGFHAYDMDICLQVQNAGKRVCVTKALLVEHYWSEDAFNNQQYMEMLDESLELLYLKWHHIFPITRGMDLPEIVIDRINTLCVKAHDAKKVRRSKAYRLGKMLLSPIKVLIRAKSK